MEKESDKSSSEENVALRKYDKLRQKRRRGTQKKWAGPSHKRFSKYFDQTDSSSASEVETDKLTAKKTIDEKDKKGPNSSTEELNQESEEEDDIFIIEPIEPPADQEKIEYPGSESEPEDPEEVKKFQMKLKLRRSRVASVSTIQGYNQDNQTMNGTTMGKSKMWLTQLSEAAHNLLELSSDEEKSSGIKFVVKDTDSEDEGVEKKKVTPGSSPKKRISRKESPTKTSPQKSFIVQEISEDQGEMLGIQKISDNLPASSPKKRVPRKEMSTKSTPKKSFILSESVQNPNDGVVETNSPLEDNREEENFQNSLKYTSSPPKNIRSNRKSTPKPKELVSTKRLTRTRSRSKRLAPDEFETEKLSSSPAKKLQFQSAEKPTRRSSRKVDNSRTTNNATFDVVSTQNSQLNTSNLATPLLGAENMPPDEPDVPDINPAVDDIPNQTSSTSISKANTEMVTQQEDNFPSTSIQENALAFAIPHQAASKSSKKTKANRRTSKRLSNRVPSPILESHDKQISAAATPVKSTRSLINKTRTQEVSAEVVTNGVHSFLAEATFARPTGLSENNNLLPISGTNPVISFMAASRLAVEDDPIQHFVLHQNSKFCSVLWKLHPGITTYSRTRGNTWILVYEGEVEVQHQKEKQTKAFQLPAGLTYFVKNIGKSIAMFHVTEFL